MGLIYVVIGQFHCDSKIIAVFKHLILMDSGLYSSCTVIYIMHLLLNAVSAFNIIVDHSKLSRQLHIIVITCYA